MTADEVIARLGLEPHPEGGAYAETYRHPTEDGTRGACTSIYYLLRAGERSHWHRVDAVEVWNFHAGDPLELSVWDGAGPVRTQVLGETGFQAVVPPGAWQAARPLGAWTLVGCIVAPAFEFAGFDLAPPGWQPGDPL